MESGRFDPDNPPEIVTRFIKLCETFKDHAHQGKDSFGAGHKLYFNCMNSLDIWGDEADPNYKIKGIGQVHRSLSGHRYEVSESLLSGLEKRFGIKESELFTGINEIVMTQLHINLSMNKASENNAGHYSCEIKVDPFIAHQFKRNNRIAPEFGISPVNSAYDRKTGIMTFEGKFDDFDNPLHFKNFLLESIIENELSMQGVTYTESELLHCHLDKLFETPLPIKIEKTSDSIIINAGENNVTMPKNHYLIDIVEKLNKLHEITRENPHEMIL